jgi:hypothetical protein
VEKLLDVGQLANLDEAKQARARQAGQCNNIFSRASEETLHRQRRAEFACAVQLHLKGSGPFFSGAQPLLGILCETLLLLGLHLLLTQLLLEAEGQPRAFLCALPN